MSRTYRLKGEYHPPGVKHYTDAKINERRWLYDEIYIAHIAHYVFDYPCILKQPLFYERPVIDRSDYMQVGVVLHETHRQCLNAIHSNWWFIRTDNIPYSMQVGTTNIHYHPYARIRRHRADSHIRGNRNDRHEQRRHLRTLASNPDYALDDE